MSSFLRRQNRNMGSSMLLRDMEGLVLVKEKDVLDLLECPICLEQMLPPIYQCMNGHPFCSGCKSKMNSSCPTCRCQLSEIRSLHFEKLVAILGFTCKYYKFGCLDKFAYDNKSQHEQKCMHRPYDCPYPYTKCGTSGVAPNIFSHLKSFHKCKVVDHPIEYEFLFAKPQEQDKITWDLVMCEHLGERFCLYIKSTVKSGNVSFIMYLMFLGDTSQQENFRYRVQIMKGNRKASHEGIPCSIRDSHEIVEDNEDGLMVNSKAARLFSLDASENVKLWITSKVWKE